ncbi:MAG TPA: tetratricopeptide repeat protein [Terriglobia bacterium]|nr:tetratricopeptide repeat protein [Terriglobia bacterium]
MSPVHLFWTLLTLAMVGLGPAEQSASEAQVRAEQALKMAREGNLHGAEVELRHSVELAPTDAFCLASLGSVLGMEQKLEESNFYLEKALRINPADTASRRNLASNFYQLGQLKPAKENLDFILKVQPGEPTALLLLGMVSEESKDYITAIRCLSLVPLLVRERSNSIVALARAYYGTGQQSQARQTLKVLQDHSSGPEGVLLGGQVASEAGDFETADHLFASIEQTYPDSAKLRYNRALLLYRANRLDECHELVQRLLLENHGTGDIYNLQAWCLYKKGKFKEAVAAMDQAINLEPRRAIHYLDLGKMLVESHRDAVALVAAQNAVEVAPASSEAYLLKGLAEYNLKLFAAAVGSYHRAVELNPDTSDALLGLALSLASSGSMDEANKTFEQGIKRFPQDAKLYQEYGRVLLDPVNGSDPESEAKAVGLLKKAIALNGALPEPHVQLGNLALAKGRVEEAASHLEMAAKLDPQNSKVFYSLSRAYRRLDKNQEALNAIKTYEGLKAREEESTRTPSK